MEYTFSDKSFRARLKNAKLPHDVVVHGLVLFEALYAEVFAETFQLTFIVFLVEEFADSAHGC